MLRQTDMFGDAKEAEVGIERGSFIVPSLTNSVSTLRIAPVLPPNCSSGETLGEELGETFSARKLMVRRWAALDEGTVHLPTVPLMPPAAILRPCGVKTP